MTAMSPIERKEFEKKSPDLKQEILAFLNAEPHKAYTSDEIMVKTHLKTDLDLSVGAKVSVFIAANFIAFLNDLATQGLIERKAINNRMYFASIRKDRMA